MEEKRTNRGRPPLGTPPQSSVVKYSSSLPKDLYERLTKFCEDEERDRSFAIRKALDAWLSERGY